MPTSSPLHLPVTVRDARNLATLHAHITTVPLHHILHLRAHVHFPSPDSPARRTARDCEDELDHYSTHYAIRLPNNTIIACATIAPDSNIVAGEYCDQRLRWLTVTPHYQHRGLAQALINIRLHHAWRFHATYVWSDALTSRAPLYENLGAVADTFIYDIDGTGPHTNIRYGPLPYTVPPVPTSPPLPSSPTTI